MGPKKRSNMMFDRLEGGVKKCFISQLESYSRGQGSGVSLGKLTQSMVCWRSLRQSGSIYICPNRPGGCYKLRFLGGK